MHLHSRYVVDLLQALWAIPNIRDSSTRTPFIVTAVFIGLATYFTVFNLNALASLGWTTYSGFRKKRIGQMMKDNYKWQERAKGFNSFEPGRGSNKPSEWYILLYCLLHLLGYEYSEDEVEDNDSSGDRGPSFVTASANSSETSRAGAWKARLGRLFGRQEDPSIRSIRRQGDNSIRSGRSSLGTAETSRVEAWKLWLERLLKRSQENSAETSQGKAWKGWVRALFTKSENNREKNGPNSV